MDRNKLGLIGCGILFVGMFAPVFRLPFVGDVDFISFSPTLAVVSVLAFGAIGIFAFARNDIANASWMGLGALSVFAISFSVTQYRFYEIRAELEERLADNPFAQAARDAYTSPGIEWGWFVLLIGAGLITYAGLSERKDRGIDHFAIIDAHDKSYVFAVGGALVLAIAGLFLGSGTAQSNIPRGSAIDAAGSTAERSAREAAVKAEATAAEQEKEAYISEYVEVYDLEARYMDSMLDGRIPGVTFKVRNKGDRTLERVEVTVEFLNSEGSPIAEEVYIPVIVGGFNADPPLRPGYIWQNERGRFLSAKAVPSEWQSGSARAFVSSVEFAEED
ncbi:MAG: hypothetical protein ACMUJI_04650 [Erythrobacter sp.]|uniref:hypothetical protein n=1 Tax=Erythrobacter sp. TaxID=1042 RepID=UPI003A83A522